MTREHYLEYQKRHYKEHKAERKSYYEKNREKINSYCKEYYQKHREQWKDYYLTQIKKQ